MRFIVILTAASSLAACATSSQGLSSHSLTVPADVTNEAVRPQGELLGTFTSALGLTCLRIAATDGDVVACEGRSGWLVVDDYTQESTLEQ